MSMEDEYAERKRKKSGSGLRPYLPVLGLFLAVALGAVSYVLGPYVSQFASTRMGLDNTPELEWVFRGALFLVLLLFVFMVFAVAVPRPKSQRLVTDRQLATEKDLRRKEQLAKKKRQREINRKMAEESRKRIQGK